MSRTNSQRKPDNGVFSEESRNGSGLRERCVCGRILKVINDFVLPAVLLQAREAVASRASEVDWPRNSISESNFLYKLSPIT